jgi:predicted ATPase with chaperone activity
VGSTAPCGSPRTVADLADSDRVEDEHVREALTLRHLPIIGAGETQLI